MMDLTLPLAHKESKNPYTFRSNKLAGVVPFTSTHKTSVVAVLEKDSPEPEDVQDDVFGSFQPPSFVPIPWQTRFKVFSLDDLQGWHDLHHVVIRQLWDELVKLHCQGQFHRQLAPVHQTVVNQHSSHHCQLAPLVDIVHFQPIKELSTVIHQRVGSHRASTPT